MENIIKSTKPSADLDELFAILFPKVINDVMRQARPKTYEELEADIDDLTSRYNKVLSQLTNAVRDVETDKISPEDLTAAFLRLPTGLALSYFGTMSTLLALNTTWQKYAPQIQEQILSKQEEQLNKQDKMIEEVEKAANKPSTQNVFNLELVQKKETNIDKNYGPNIEHNGGTLSLPKNKR